jgi:hypothetical protein
MFSILEYSSRTVRKDSPHQPVDVAQDGLRAAATATIPTAPAWAAVGAAHVHADVLPRQHATCGARRRGLVQELAWAWA